MVVYAESNLAERNLVYVTPRKMAKSVDFHRRMLLGARPVPYLQLVYPVSL